MEKVMRYQTADYLNVGTSDAPEWALMGVGFNSLDESPNAQTDQKTYINQKNSSSSVVGYEPQFPFDADFIKDETAIKTLWDIARNRKTGSDAELEYVRVDLYDPDSTTTGTYPARKFTVSVEVSDMKGDGGDPQTLSGNLNQVGDHIDGTFDTTTKTFTAKE